jgi:monothiol glutaredoxin
VSNPVFETIQNTINQHAVVLYMKGDASAPMCGFSARVVQILNHFGLPFHSVNVMTDPEVREGIKQFNEWPTIPQLFVKGEFIGGCDIVSEMAMNGEFEQLLLQNGLVGKAG